MLRRKLFQITAGSAFLGLAMAGRATAGIQESKHAREAGSAARVPSSVKAEHTELHEELAKAINSGGQTAVAAKNVERLLHPHFVKEEQFGLPPLAVLTDLAAGKVPPNAKEIITMSEHLQKELPTMLAEHEAIGKALQRLRAVAQQERKPEVALFADHLQAHAKQEEEILYPAAILAGQYLKLKQH